MDGGTEQHASAERQEGIVQDARSRLVCLFAEDFATGRKPVGKASFAQDLRLAGSHAESLVGDGQGNPICM